MLFQAYWTGLPQHRLLSGASTNPMWAGISPWFGSSKSASASEGIISYYRILWYYRFNFSLVPGTAILHFNDTFNSDLPFFLQLGFLPAFPITQTFRWLWHLWEYTLDEQRCNSCWTSYSAWRPAFWTGERTLLEFLQWLFPEFPSLFPNITFSCCHDQFPAIATRPGNQLLERLGLRIPLF